MKMSFMKCILYLLVLLPLLPLSSGLAQSSKKQRQVTSADVKAITAAVQDEIYDYGYYDKFYQIGNNIGDSVHRVSRLHIYINPKYHRVDGYGEVIYKLMPFGQVYRLFYLGSNGSVKLDGDPQNKFPITQPSHQTVFMDDEEVCHYEQSWIKGFFTVDVAPNAKIIKGAAKRQKLRTGFSDWEYEHPDQNGSNE